MYECFVHFVLDKIVDIRTVIIIAKIEHKDDELTLMLYSLTL